MFGVAALDTTSRVALAVLALGSCAASIVSWVVGQKRHPFVHAAIIVWSPVAAVGMAELAWDDSFDIPSISEETTVAALNFAWLNMVAGWIWLQLDSVVQRRRIQPLIDKLQPSRDS